MCLIRCEAEPDFPRRILWTDEASFKLNGRINSHNNVYWSDSNPHEVIQEELNVPSCNCPHPSSMNYSYLLGWFLVNRLLPC
jgi:hypothetical protein